MGAERASRDADPARTPEVRPATSSSPRSPAVQAKLVVGPADDRYEREADEVARRVIDTLRRQTSPADALSDEQDLPVGPMPPDPPLAVGRVQAKAEPATIGAEGGDLDAETDRAIRSAAGAGAPLDESVRTRMESGFGADFSGVRVHHDDRSDQLNRRIQAKAFTTGNDIFFSRGEYSPATSSGQELLAHELTHVIQQGSSVQRRWGRGKNKAPAPEPVIGGPTDVRINGADPRQGIANMGYDAGQVIDVSPEARAAEEQRQKLAAQTEKYADQLTAWRAVWGGIDLDASDEEKMDALLAEFKDNAINFSYKGQAKPFDVQGDCASQSATFKIIAESALGVTGKISYDRQPGRPGWYIAPGLQEIGGRKPNVSDGGYYFISHTWLVWNGTVYDVLFGEKGQNGVKATGRSTVDGQEYLQVGDRWYVLVEQAANRWEVAAAPG